MARDDRAELNVRPSRQSSTGHRRHSRRHHGHRRRDSFPGKFYVELMRRLRAHNLGRPGSDLSTPHTRRSSRDHSIFAGKPGSRNYNLIAHRWQPGREIGRGAFSSVISATDVRTNELVAVKIGKGRRGMSMLRTENRVYEALEDLGKGNEIQECRFFGMWGTMRVLVLELLGPSVLRLKQERGGMLSLRRVLRIAIGANRALKNLHDAGYLHRDIKPENLLTGRYDSDRVYVVDFGTAKHFLNALQDKDRRPFGLTDRLVGDLEYASVNCMTGNEPSFRDDFISLGYSIISLCKGRLPWQQVLPSSKSGRTGYYLRMKERTTLRELCRGTCPEIRQFFDYVESLRFSNRVDHRFVHDLLRGGLYRHYGEIY